MIKNKKGSEFTINTLVVIIIALVVLVILALGFTGGFGKIWEGVSSFFSSVNLDRVKDSCNLACTSKAKYDYCCVKRDVTFVDSNNKKDSWTYSGTKAKTCYEYTKIFPFYQCAEFSCLDETICGVKK